MEVSQEELIRRISGDVKQWNSWRKVRNNVRFDLSGIQFPEGIALYNVDLSNFNLAGSSFYHRRFGGTDFHDSDLSDADFRSADLTNCNLDNTILYRTNLNGADISLSNLRYADFNETMIERVNFTFADLTGAVFTKVEWQETNIWGVVGLSEEALDQYMQALMSSFRSVRSESAKGVRRFP